ncbi:hypothetical protein E2C01_020662 [Portunus trituberculatus]|uniref:Uncharacterized protein n=1 Tax=Portunus trituberculatus TaxID=210409 RepID=A0A5B7E0F4_PORTR|nr:hypothetical protein [Portunus trituberculatus]
MLRRAGLHPPPTHPPPPPPLGQLVKVDISRSKSDYATVGVAPSTPDSAPLSPAIQSSFRPTDCAKLYASPEEVKAVGYRSPDSAGRKGASVKTRSQSLPPSTSRPSVQRGSPERAAQAAYSASSYSTFRGEGREGSRSQEPLTPAATAAPSRPPVSDTVTYARPKNNRSVQEMTEGSSPNRTCPQAARAAPPTTPAPDIPEPDYSSDEQSSAALSLSQDDSRKTRTLKKKKQSVAFSPNLVTAAGPPTPPQQDADGPHYAAPARSPAPLGSLGSNNFRDMIAQKAAERQARQDDGPEGSQSANSSPAKRLNNGNGNGALGDAIQESALFNRQREKSSPAPQGGRPAPGPSEDLKTGRIMRNSKSCPSEFLEDGDNSSSGVSSDQDPAEAYVTVINTESDTISAAPSGNGGSDRFLGRQGSQGSRDDSSEASESSDEASDRTWILTNERSGDRSDSSRDSDSNGARRSGSLTRNAVSLVKLPPPQETTEADVEGEAARQGDQDTLSTVSSLSSLSSGSGGSGGERERSHPPLIQAQHSLPSASHPQMRATLPRTPTAVSRAASAPPQTTHGMKGMVGGSLARGRPREQLWGSEEAAGLLREKSAPPATRTLDRSAYKGADGGETEYERSIEESLQLIRMHMDSLNEHYAPSCLKTCPRAGESGEVFLALEKKTSAQTMIYGGQKINGHSLYYPNPNMFLKLYNIAN